MDKARGFSIVELIVSIVLIGVLSVGIGSRFFGVGAYTTSSAHNQLIGQARLAQRIALANSGLDIKLVLLQSGGDWIYRIVQDDGGVLSTLNEIVLDAEDITLAVTVA